MTPDEGWQEELSPYDLPPEVCMTHRRMAPCRKGGPHAYSTDPADVAMVAGASDI